MHVCDRGTKKEEGNRKDAGIGPASLRDSSRYFRGPKINWVDCIALHCIAAHPGYDGKSLPYCL